MNVRNWEKARKYFGIENQSNLVMHHKDVSLKYTDKERYEQWNPDDLVVMTISEHMKLHRNHTGKNHTENTKQKMRIAALGRKHNDDVKQKMSESHKGKHWKLVDGKRIYFSAE